MKFFVPCTETRDDSEGCWFAIRDWLAERGLFTTDRRIASLVCAIDGADHIVTVGRPTPFGDLAVVILEASADPGLFYVCAYQRGVFEGRPYRMRAERSWHVRDFEEDEQDGGEEGQERR